MSTHVLEAEPNVIPVDQPADVLDAAATYLETYGWFKGDYFENGGGGSLYAMPLLPEKPCRACALGAIRFVTGNPKWSDSQPAAEALEEAVGDSVPEWNDCTVEDANEVIETLRKVAKSIREEKA